MRYIHTYEIYFEMNTVLKISVDSEKSAKECNQRLQQFTSKSDVESHP